jgi:methylmalonyl-CoA mutase C-terminal domain/subunit
MVAGYYTGSAAVLLSPRFIPDRSTPRGDPMPRKIRVLVGKPGLDGHDRGAKVVAAALRDAGMEVIYTGLHQSSEQIVDAALQEDVDVVALSILSGAHMTQFTEVLALMKRRGLGDRLLTGGGIIPPEDMGTLARRGVGRLFGPGTSTQDIAAYIREWFAEKRLGEGAKAAPARSTARPAVKKTARKSARSSAPPARRPSGKRARKG